MHDITHQTYEDPEVVKKYVEKNAHKLYEPDVTRFLEALPGNRILDLGCGPGQFSYLFAEKGYHVTGIDYSSQMITQAQNFKEIENKPDFKVGDMRKLPEYFEENSFDGVWASASLLHIKKQDIDSVLEGISFIAKPKASIFISLKSGSGTHLVTEDVYAKNKEREFTLWEKDAFAQVVEKNGLKISVVTERSGRMFQGQPTSWLCFFLTV
jgi:ubiquinone/menaquinone biosynthesis C-methylase UbiE